MKAHAHTNSLRLFEQLFLNGCTQPAVENAAVTAALTQQNTDSRKHEKKTAASFYVAFLFEQNGNSQRRQMKWLLLLQIHLFFSLLSIQSRKYFKAFAAIARATHKRHCTSRAHLVCRYENCQFIFYCSASYLIHAFVQSRSSVLNVYNLSLFDLGAPQKSAYNTHTQT